VFTGISEYKISIFFRKVFVDNIEIIIHYKVIFTHTVPQADQHSALIINRLLLLRRQERLRSIVMSMSVCPRGYLWKHRRDAIFTIFFAHVAYVRGLVLF